MSEVKFEPFQKVLVRDCDDSKWEINLFERMVDGKYLCLAGAYYQCLPFNVETAHFLGTTDSPTTPEPEFKWGDHVEVRDGKGEAWKAAIFTCENNNGYMAIIKGALSSCTWQYCRHADW